MATYQEVDLFLAHHGVPGMKWGHHKAQQFVAGTVGVAKKIGGSYANKAQASINKSGGSKSKAITKAVGKDLLTGLTIAGGQKILDVGLSALPMNHAAQMSIRSGAARVGQILQIANHVQGAAKITAIATRPSSKEKS